MIKLKQGLVLKALKDVECRDRNWNMPGRVILKEGSIIKIYTGPTSLSDVPFEILIGKASWWQRTPRLITPEERIVTSGDFFFFQGHETSCPYDFGSLSSDLFEVILNES